MVSILVVQAAFALAAEKRVLLSRRIGIVHSERSSVAFRHQSEGLVTDVADRSVPFYNLMGEQLSAAATTAAISFVTSIPVVFFDIEPELIYVGPLACEKAGEMRDDGSILSTVREKAVWDLVDAWRFSIR